MMRCFAPCLFALLALLVAPGLAHADDGDDTLAFYLSKADLVVVGTINELGNEHAAGDDHVFYLGASIQVEEVLAGEYSDEELHSVAIVQHEMVEEDRHSDLREGGKWIFFLRKDGTGLRHWSYVTADIWFGLTRYSPAMARSLKRLADQQAEEGQPVEPDIEDAHLNPADGSHIRGEFIDLGDNDWLLLRYMPIVDSGVEIERVTDGEVVWRVHADGLGVAHSRYKHDIRAEVEDGQLILNSYGSAGTFMERRDLVTGALLERSADNQWGAAQDAIDTMRREERVQQEATENTTRQDDTADVSGILPPGDSPEAVEARLRHRIAELEAQIAQMRSEVAGLPSRSIIMVVREPGECFGPQVHMGPPDCVEFQVPTTPSFDQWPWVNHPDAEAVDTEAEPALEENVSGDRG